MEGSPHIFYPLASYTHWLQRPHEQKAPRLMQGNGCFLSFHRSFSLLFSSSPALPPSSARFWIEPCSPSLLMSHSAPFLSAKTTLLLVNQLQLKITNETWKGINSTRRETETAWKRRVANVNKKNRLVRTRHANFTQASYVNR